MIRIEDFCDMKKFEEIIEWKKQHQANKGI